MRKTSILAALIILFYAALPLAADTPSIPIESWLKAGPFNSPLPAFSTVKNFELLLDDMRYDMAEWRPDNGDMVQWSAGKSAKWEMAGSDSGLVIIKDSGFDKPATTYLASYITAQTYCTGTLNITGSALYAVFLDGKRVISQKSVPDEPKAQSYNFSLEKGSHCIMVKTAVSVDFSGDWTVSGSIHPDTTCPAGSIQSTVTNAEAMTVEKLLQGPRPANTRVSPSGKYALINITEVSAPAGESESYTEIRRLPSGSLVHTIRGSQKMSQVRWSPDETYISYVTRDKSKASLWLYDLENKSAEPLLSSIENFSYYIWSPDSKTLFYVMGAKSEENDPDLKRYTKMEERWPWYGSKSSIYMVSADGGARIRLTSSRHDISLQDVSPDSRRLLITQTVSDYSDRPYSYTRYFLLNLETMKVDTLFSDRWAGSAQFSPDGDRLLVTGGASAFSGKGVNVPEGVIPNESDTQMYLYTIETGNVQALTLHFKPSVSQAVWHKKTGDIFLTANDRDCVSLYHCEPKNGTFTRIRTGLDVVHSFDIAQNGKQAVYTGSDMFQWPVAMHMDINKQIYTVLSDPAKEWFRHVKFGSAEQCIYKDDDGKTIDGRVYLPPGFDPGKKYPCIVYYYGGTSPVTRDFGGRYPKEIWADNGYVVYVPQPSGATGYGQEFSARHVNNWGKTVADEIIECAEAFIQDHSYVDSEKVGCIGASYGGFMTMLLVTRTDMFSAAVAHAGISSISSYWGEGYWGYLYSATATAESFPWNRKDIYVDQSPLFAADKVHTPILLVHGASDTNVPVGESIQFYTALKLLGRDAELVTVKGQDHHIMQYAKRKQWTKTILAYFDWKLKGDSRWWDAMYDKKQP